MRSNKCIKEIKVKRLVRRIKRLLMQYYVCVGKAREGIGMWLVLVKKQPKRAKEENGKKIIQENLL